MATTYLKFPTEAEALTALEQYRHEDRWITASHTHALDVVGTIYQPTGNIIQGEYGEYPEMAPIPGFHVNFIGEVPEAALPFAITPENPVRVFA